MNSGVVDGTSRHGLTVGGADSLATFPLDGLAPALPLQSNLGSIQLAMVVLGTLFFFAMVYTVLKGLHSFASGDSGNGNDGRSGTARTRQSSRSRSSGRGGYQGYYYYCENCGHAMEDDWDMTAAGGYSCGSCGYTLDDQNGARRVYQKASAADWE